MRTIVKVGGAQLATPERMQDVIAHVRSLVREGREVVLVHGGGGEIGDLHERLGLPRRTERGLRVTPDASMDIVAMVLCGLVNKRLVAGLVEGGVPALGLSGADLGLMQSGFLNQGRLGRVGGPPRVRADRLERFLDEGAMLVLAPVCLGPDGGLVNVNADTAAQAVAVALGAECLEYVTDVAAVRTPTGNARTLSIAEAQRLLADSVIQGGMIPKMHATLAALDGGVSRVRVGTPHSLSHGTATEVSA